MSSSHPIERAFILGAGLGTRLRPITEHLPKPLVSIQGKPLVTFALDHLEKLGVQKVIINTHHAADQWPENFPESSYRSLQLQFRHEPLLLDTGGGLKNVEDFFPHPSTFLIYNGDIWTSLPLEKAVAHHQAQGNLVTMILRSNTQPKHVSLHPDGKVSDIRGMLGTSSKGDFLFTGIHVVQSDIFQYIPDARPQSIISIYLDLIRQKLPIGGIVLDEGNWSDIGTPEEYHKINQTIPK